MIKGFTLIEMMIAVSVSAVFLLSVSTLCLRQSAFCGTFSSYCINTAQCGHAGWLIRNEVRSSSGISPLSGPSKLVLDQPGYQISFELSLGRLKRTKGTSVMYITDEDTIKGLSFFLSGKLVTTTIVPELSGAPLTVEAFCRS